MKKNTVLFDLDGTLLPVELDDFLKQYFKYLTEDLSDIFKAEELVKAVMKATDDMLKNDGDRLNSEVFRDSFFKLIKVKDPEEVMGRFDRFYESKFPLLKETIPVNDKSVNLVNFLKKNGYQLVIATNPVFPLAAIKERIHWIKLDPDDFIFITCYENMHYCKPATGYYREILEKCSLSAEECIMVGNDNEEDMVAGKLGITTMLVTDYLIDHGPGRRYKPDWVGTMEELIEYFQELQGSY